MAGHLLQAGQHGPGHADAGDAGTFVSEQVLGAGPALVLFADEVLYRHTDVVEEHLVDFMLAVEGDDRPHGDARGLHVDQQEGNAALLLGLRIGAHQAEDPVGVVGVGGPDLLAVHHVVVAVTHRAGLQRRQVGAGARLGIALAPPVLAAEDARQEARLLLRSAELDDHRRHHLHAEGNHTRRTGGSALLLEDVLLHDVPASAAIFRRPARGEPAALVERAHPLDLIFLAQALALQDAAGVLHRQFIAQEGSNFVAEGELLGCELDFQLLNLDFLDPPGRWAGCRSGMKMPQGAVVTQWSKTITERASSPRRSSSKASLICSSLMRWEIISSSFRRPCM
ncbi:hypothetical protein D9M71_248220 [compost metagenome]